MKKITDQDGINSGISISSPQTTATRLLGSHPAPLKRKDDDNGFPDGEPNPPPPPPPPVSVPDIAFQFSPCLEAIPVPPGTDLESALLDAVRTVFGASADVRYQCLENTGRVGIWLRPSGSDSVSQARNRGMERIEILRAGENFAFFINSGLIRRNAQDAWGAMPKRLNGDGQPDPNGPIHLTSFNLSFQSPNHVVTKIGGYDERPWPDVDFDLTITDTLSDSAGQVQCQTDTDLDVDESWLNILTGIFLFLGAVVSGWFLLPAAIFLVQRIIVGSVDDPDPNAGAGCAAAQLIPREIMIQGGQKIVAIYNRVDVSAGGIFAGGTALVVPRTPSVEIQGPLQISVDSGNVNVTRTYRAIPDDLYGNLQTTWSANGAVLAQGSLSTPVRFSLTGAEPGETLLKQVQVRITDEDNLMAMTEKSIRIFVTMDDPDIPPVCKVKPWLPQCQEAFARSGERHRERESI